MIVLLSIGEALLTQARDEKLVGGGDVTVLPEGIDVEVLKTGGLGGMFFSIDHARFVYSSCSPRRDSRRQFGRRAADRGQAAVRAHANGREVAVMASGEIPSATAAVGAMPPLAIGDVDRRRPRSHVARSTAERAAQRDRSLSSSAARRATRSDLGGVALLQRAVARSIDVGVHLVHRRRAGSRRAMGRPGARDAARRRAGRRVASSPTVPASAVRFSTTRPTCRWAASSVSVLADGRYAVRAHAREERRTGHGRRESRRRAGAARVLPGAALSSGETVSGYVVPGLRADATGSICVNGSVRALRRRAVVSRPQLGRVARRDVGVGSGARRDRTRCCTVACSRGQHVASQPLFVYVVDSLGFLALFRPREIRYEDSRDDDRRRRRPFTFPARARWSTCAATTRCGSTLTIEDATATDTRRPGVERGDGLSARQLARPYFVQMKGLMTISGRSRPADRRRGRGFFETYR